MLLWEAIALIVFHAVRVFQACPAPRAGLPAWPGSSSCRTFSGASVLWYSYAFAPAASTRNAPPPRAAGVRHTAIKAFNLFASQVCAVGLEIY